MIWGEADRIVIEIKWTIYVMCLNHPQTISPHLWKIYLPWNSSLVPERLGINVDQKSKFPHVCMHAQLCPTLFDPTDCSPPDSSVHGIFQVEYWSGLPFPPPGNLFNPCFLCLLHWHADSLPLVPPGKLWILRLTYFCNVNYFLSAGKLRETYVIH